VDVSERSEPRGGLSFLAEILTITALKKESKVFIREPVRREWEDRERQWGVNVIEVLHTHV
jgi:hypothetical protein